MAGAKERNMLHIIDLDLERSKKECPPQNPPGGKHLKRIRSRRDLTTWPEAQPYRVLVNNQPHVRDLTNSYSINHMIYTEPPQVVVVDPDNPKRFIGIIGYQRNKAQENLGWDMAIYDVVEYDTPLDQLEHGFTSNTVQNPRAGSTIEDLAKGACLAIERKLIPNTDKAIKAHINRIAADKTDPQKRNIFKKVRNKKSAHDSMRPLDGKSANELAAEHEIPYGGGVEESYEVTGQYGFIKEPGGFKTVMHDGLRLWLEYDEPIYVTGYITHPNPATIKSRRNTWEKEIVRLNEMIYKISAKVTGMDLDSVRELGNSPFISHGFLPQIISPDVTKGGKEQETSRVDKDGNSLDNS